MEKESTEVSGLQTKITPEPRGERGQCLGDPEGKTVSVCCSHSGVHELNLFTRSFGTL